MYCQYSSNRRLSGGGVSISARAKFVAEKLALNKAEDSLMKRLLASSTQLRFIVFNPRRPTISSASLPAILSLIALRRLYAASNTPRRLVTFVAVVNSTKMRASRPPPSPPPQLSCISAMERSYSHAWVGQNTQVVIQRR